MELKDLKFKIIELIAMDELQNALNLLKENMPMNHPRYVSLIMQMRRLNNLKNKTNNATIAFEEASMERNKISQSLIEMTQSLSESPPPPPIADKVPIDVSPVQTEPPRVEQPPKYQDDLLDDYEDDFDENYEDEFNQLSNELKGYQKEVFYKGSPAKEEKTIVFNLTYDMAFLKCIQAINYNGFTLKQQNQSMGYIQASSGFSIWSFGEEIHIYLKELDDGMKTYVHIICDSTIKTTVTSWGKNAKNINKIITTLTQG